MLSPSNRSLAESKTLDEKGEKFYAIGAILDNYSDPRIIFLPKYIYYMEINFGLIFRRGQVLGFIISFHP